MFQRDIVSVQCLYRPAVNFYQDMFETKGCRIYYKARAVCFVFCFFQVDLCWPKTRAHESSIVTKCSKLDNPTISSENRSGKQSCFFLAAKVSTVRQFGFFFSPQTLYVWQFEGAMKAFLVKLWCEFPLMFLCSLVDWQALGEHRREVSEWFRLWSKLFNNNTNDSFWQWWTI